MNERKLVLIDGAGMLSSAYYGTLPNEIKWEKDEEKKRMHYDKLMHTSTGIYTNAIYAMLRIINKILNQQQPTHMAFCFDKSRANTFRRQMYSEYKAQRGVSAEPLKQQMIEMQQILSHIGFNVFYGDEYEADDYIGTLAKKFEDTIPVYLYTKDHDYLQLITDKTKMWLVLSKESDAKALFDKYGIDMKSVNCPDKTFELTYDLVKKEYGVYPEQIPDLKGLQGDTSDNIPGVYGVSSAAPILLSEYNTIENLYDYIMPRINDKKEIAQLKEDWKKLGITRSPLNNLISDCDKKTNLPAKETALLSKTLATIKTDIPLNTTLDELEVDIDRISYMEELKRLEITTI